MEYQPLIPSLYRDFGIIVVNAFDTQVAALELGLTLYLNLSSLCEYYGLPNSKEYGELKQKYPLYDWRIRPLTKDMLQYGLFDVRFLYVLKQLLVRDLQAQK